LDRRAVTLSEINAVTGADFVARFGDIAEHSPWVAERAEQARPYATHRAMVHAFQRAILDAVESRQTALILAHPDLAGRAALRGDVADESKTEQKGAGLDTLTVEELERFHALNAAYRAQFGFPFILAVTGATKYQVIEAFENRLGGTMEEERLTAIAQILRIVRFRLEARVSK